eukprot:8101279-Pyramimonas_sp.AAC.1
MARAGARRGLPMGRIEDHAKQKKSQRVWTQQLLQMVRTQAVAKGAPLAATGERSPKPSAHFLLPDSPVPECSLLRINV